MIRQRHAGGVIAVAGALPMEVAGIRRLGAFRRAAFDGGSYYTGDIHGREVALFVSGAGELRAYETARAACRALALKAYISIGLSASLSEDLKPGSLVVAGSVASLMGDKVRYCDERLLKLAGEAIAGGARFGPIAASGTVVATSKDKKEIASSCGCLALDMETYGAARAAYEAGVPFMAVRAISDALDEDLPVDFDRFLKDGKLDWPRFALHVLAHPGAVPGLMRLGKNSRMAARNLADAVERLIREI